MERNWPETLLFKGRQLKPLAPQSRLLTLGDDFFAFYQDDKGVAGFRQTDYGEIRYVMGVNILALKERTDAIDLAIQNSWKPKYAAALIGAIASMAGIEFFYDVPDIRGRKLENMAMLGIIFEKLILFSCAAAKQKRIYDNIVRYMEDTRNHTRRVGEMIVYYDHLKINSIHELVSSPFNEKDFDNFLKLSLAIK